MPILEKKYAYIHQGSPANVYNASNKVIGYLYDNEVWWIRSYELLSGQMTGYISHGNGTYYTGFISNPHGAEGLPPDYIDHGSGQGYSRTITTYNCERWGSSYCSPWGGGSAYTLTRSALYVSTDGGVQGTLPAGYKVVFGFGQGYPYDPGEGSIDPYNMQLLRMYGYITSGGTPRETFNCYVYTNFLHGRANYNINTA